MRSNRIHALAACSIACLAGVSLMSLSGCSKPTGLTAQQRADRLPIVSQDWRKLGYRWDWNAIPVLLEGEKPLRTEAHGEIVVFQETGGTISAIDDQVGQTIWSNKPAGDLTKFTGMDRRGDIVYVSSESELFMLDAQTGELVGRNSFEKLVSTDFILADNTAVVGSASGEVMGHYMPNDIKVWGHDMPGTFEEDLVAIGPVVGGVTSTGRVVCVDTRSNRQTGQNDIYKGPGGPLAASDELMYVASLDQSLYAFRAADARLAWKHLTPNPIVSQPVYHENVLYCSLPDTGLTAFDAQTGDVLWESEGQFGHVIGIRNGRLMVFDGKRMTAIEPQRGIVLESIALSNVVHLSMDPFVDGDIYLTSREGVVAKFVADN